MVRHSITQESHQSPEDSLPWGKLMLSVAPLQHRSSRRVSKVLCVLDGLQQLLELRNGCHPGLLCSCFGFDLQRFCPWGGCGCPRRIDRSSQVVRTGGQGPREEPKLRRQCACSPGHKKGHEVRFRRGGPCAARGRLHNLNVLDFCAQVPPQAGRAVAHAKTEVGSVLRCLAVQVVTSWRWLALNLCRWRRRTAGSQLEALLLESGGSRCSGRRRGRATPASTSRARTRLSINEGVLHDDASAVLAKVHGRFRLRTG
mmetsp:Transcript_65861/g.157411  ORF Transcript_65861/g.157411 Transcript_65861/m.157411 type:complete len:257 (-) Transcript_65861:183-953(-)